MTKGKDKKSEKTGKRQDAGGQPPEQPGGVAGVRRPLIGAFDGAAPLEGETKTSKARDADNPGELKDIDKKDVALLSIRETSTSGATGIQSSIRS